MFCQWKLSQSIFQFTRHIGFNNILKSPSYVPLLK